MKRKDFKKYLSQFGLSYQDFKESWFSSRQIQINFGTVKQDTEQERYKKAASYLESVSLRGLNCLYSEIDDYIRNPDEDKLDKLKQEIEARIFIADKAISYKQSYPLSKGTKLYRVVKLPDDIKDISTFKEIVPMEKVKQYRLNTKTEQMFYVAFSKEVAISETGVTDLDKYALLTYEVKSDVDLVAIVRNPDKLAELGKFTKFYGDKSNEILVNIFSRPASSNEAEYNLSNYIKKHSEFSLDNNCLGWIYPSVKSTATDTINYSNFCVALPEKNYEEVVDLKTVKWKFSQACDGVNYKY